MLIDFHTHLFPKKIAQESVEKLARAAGVRYYGDGSADGLRDFMRRDGVTLSVNQPVATKPEQVTSINRKMVEMNRAQKEILCFGAMYPGLEGFEGELAFLASRGVKGIKMHSEYQEFRPEEPRLRPLFEACAEHGLIVVFHSGADLGYPDVHCTPEGVKELLSIPRLTLVLAHMGAYRMWDEVEKHLVGRDVYFDLAYCNEMDDGRLRRMIRAHGSERILFATDFPWERARVMEEKLYALGLDEKENEDIRWKNASRLLGLSA